MENIFEQNTTQLIVHFLSFLFALMAVIISLGIVWQAERRLDKVYKVMSWALAIFSFMLLVKILELIDVVTLHGLEHFIELIFIFLVTVSLYTMNKTLKDVWKEKK